MKKLFRLVLVLGIIVSINLQMPTFAQNQKDQVRQNFEKRLNLSEKQKKKAKAIHEKGFEQMKPVMTQIELKHYEIMQIKKSSQDEKTKQEKLSQTKAELKVLNNKAREIRKENSKEFENILTKKQKQELEKMKAEGRKKFEKKHPPRPPFNMFGPASADQKQFFHPQKPADLSK